MLAALLLMLAAIAPPDLAIEPEQPIAGQPVKISFEQGGGYVHLASPFGAWTLEREAAGTSISIDLPADLPVLMAGLHRGEEVEFTCHAWPVRGTDGKPVRRAQFWMAYLQAGFPSPFSIVERDPGAALNAVRAEAERLPEDAVVRELLWRLEAGAAEDKVEYLGKMEGELGGSPTGRLVLAAARVCHQLGYPTDSAAVAGKYKEQVLAQQHAEAARWSGIVGLRDARERARLIHQWLEEDPFSDYVPSMLQILAATYSEMKDYRSTAVYGLLSLRISPDDAMTLNGVAFAMAEGDFELERGLMLVTQAITILQNPDRLNKPPQLSENRWREELNHALAASFDTNGWLLTKLQRWDEARQAFNAAIALERQDVYYLHLGLMSIEQGDKAAAVEAFRKGARLGGPNRLRIESELSRLNK
jgi:tetratricopeptide (TPR) repeat protein